MPEGGRVALRPVTAGDCRRLWAWRNQPSIRQASFRTEVIPYEEHCGWFQAALAEPRRPIFIAEDVRGEPIGYVRFAISGEEASISVGIDEARRGQGYGAAAIRQGAEALLAARSAHRIVARIRRDNTISLAAFSRAGFVQRAALEVDGTAAYELIYERLGTALFYVDAGPGAGMGHLQRSLALAEAFRRGGMRCRVLAPSHPDVRSRVAAAGCDLVEQTGRTAAEEVAAAAGEDTALVVMDSYRIGAEELARLRAAAGWRLMVIDDLARAALPCHVVVNGAAGAESLPYASSTGDTEFLLGPAYAMLRSEYWVLPPRRLRPSPRRALVVLGGADPQRLTPRLVRGLRLPGAEEVTVVIGPFAECREETERAVQERGSRVRVAAAPESLCALLQDADVAVSAGGQTLYELARAGCPTVAISVAPNQEPQVRALAEAGVVLAAGRAGDGGLVERVAAGIERLWSDAARREAMAAAGRRMVDGQGALRVAEALRRRILGAREAR